MYLPRVCWGEDSEHIEQARGPQGRRACSLFTKRLLTDALQLADPPPDLRREQPHLFVGVVRRPERVLDLLVREAREEFADPTRVLRLDVAHQPAVLPAEVEAHHAALDALDELVRGVVLRLVTAALDVAQQGHRRLLPAGRPEGRAEGADDVVQLRPARAAHRQDTVVRVLQVPVLDERHQDFEPLEFALTREGVRLPAPLVEPLDVPGPRLEADVLERALPLDGRAR